MTLQSVRTCQQVFSAAFIAHVEASCGDDDAKKNELCAVVPHPNSDLDFVRTTLANALSTLRWAQEPGLAEWVASSRLDIFHAAALTARAGDPLLVEAQQRLAQHMFPAIEKMRALLAAQ
jgi:hypothetical protein